MLIIKEEIKKVKEKLKNMKTNLKLREFLKEDAAAIESIICEAWHYTELCSAQTARKLAKVFLSSCLANQTYTQVAVLDNVPAGIIMAKNIKAHRCPLKYRLRQALAILSLYLTREGRKTAKIFSCVNETDKQLLNDCNKEYKGELSFFAVSAPVRGTGAGKKLFHSALHYMKSQDMNNFYLFTDTSCNYGFYEHQGMVRRGAKNKSFMIDGKRKIMTFFIYDCHIRDLSE